tara:strand:- start:148 stop:729 length:582 start_codon:yes stop_codon:yes gene_type:complete
MSKKLLSETQVRKFMGLANLDANISSNFLTEMYGIEEEEEIEMDAEEAPMPEEEPTAPEMDAELEGGVPEETDESDVDVEIQQSEVEDAKESLDALQAKLGGLLSKLMGGSVPEMGTEMIPAEMDAEEPAMEPEIELGADEEIPDEEEEMMETTNTHHQISEEEIVQEVAKRVAKRINEAARAQKKADKLLNR